LLRDVLAVRRIMNVVVGVYGTDLFELAISESNDSARRYISFTRCYGDHLFNDVFRYLFGELSIVSMIASFFAIENSEERDKEFFVDEALTRSVALNNEKVVGECVFRGGKDVVATWASAATPGGHTRLRLARVSYFGLSVRTIDTLHINI
jgi:hypothetical protein